MSVEPIVSDELLAELGNDPHAVLVGKKRKQPLSEEEKKKKYIPEEELKKFKKLSKKEQKRVDQRNKKKERASRQGEYMEIIKANEISDQQRDMLLSSRQLNHTATLREQLSMLLKKERAGIKLSAEELELLYPNYSHQNDSDDEESSEPDFPPLQSTSNAKEVSSSNEISTEQANGETLFSFTTLFNAPPKKDVNISNDSDADSSVGRNKKIDKKKKKKKSEQNSIEDTSVVTNFAVTKPGKEDLHVIYETTASPPIAAETTATVTEKKPFSAAGLGKNLLAQFSKIKEQQSGSDLVQNEKDMKVSTIFSSEFDYNSNAPSKFESVVPAVPESIKALLANEEPKAPVISKPVIKDTFYSYCRNMTIQRPHDVAVARMNLPVCQMEQEIVEAVNMNDVIILCGETGSGKSTQVPQFLYEAGYAQDEEHLIGIAQPRRVAVTSTAERVNFEMGCTLPEIAQQKKLNKHKKNLRKQKEKLARRRAQGLSDGTLQEDEEESLDESNEDEEQQIAKYYPNGRKVGYQIRYDATTVGSDTRIKFMTDGILLREISQDLLLRKYSVIILDEAHERNVNTDILLGMISRAIPLRKEIAAKEYNKWKRMSPEARSQFSVPLTPLKLIIMSATLRVDDFRQERLFNPLPPIIKVEARQYPVTNHFAKRTEIKDYLQETFKKTCQIHERLPPGGVLLFLTGKREILYMCKRLQKALGRKYLTRRHSQSRNSSQMQENSIEPPLESMLADLQHPSSDTNNSNDRVDSKQASKQDYDDMEIGFDGDQIDEVEIGEDDYDAMNWNHSDKEDDGSHSDNESVLSDIEDEDYVSSVSKSKSSEPKDGAKSTDDDDEPTRLRKEMLAKILGSGKSTSEGANTESNNKDDKKTDDNSPTEEEKKEETFGDYDLKVEEQELPKLKPWILPLYAMMPAHLQKRVFAEVPPGYRLIVVATNVAETSITIPGIRYVVDSGRCKEKVLANANVGSETNGEGSTYEAGITRYEVRWISKASSDQRAGRAGRTGPGHCYRLYSSNFYHEHMQSFMPPEINVTPLEDIVLHMLSLGITEIESFPFPSNPPRAAVQAAVTLLKNLGAILPETAVSRAKERNARLWALLNSNSAEAAAAQKEDSLQSLSLGHLSPLGKMLRWFPIHPRFAKMLVVATQTTQQMDVASSSRGGNNRTAQARLLSHVLTMVATLTERSVFVFDDIDEKDEDDESDDDDDDDNDGERDDFENDDDDDDPSHGSSKKRKHPTQKSSSASQRPKKTPKSATKKAKDLQARKLFYHTSGDVMARLRATGAYLFTVQAVLARQRKERAESKKAPSAPDNRNPSSDAQGNGTEPNAMAVDNEDRSDELDGEDDGEEEERNKPYQKWEYDLANQDSSVIRFCSQFHLHQGTLQRIVDLRNQLQHILEGLYPRLISEKQEEISSHVLSFPAVLEPPSASEEIALRQILLSGYCDQIAKRAPYASIDSFLQRQQQLQQSKPISTSGNDKPVNFLSRRRKFTAFLSGHPSLQTTGPVYLHPTSNCYAHDITQASETLPEYIVYTHMMKNQRGDSLYLTNVTVIAPQWIAAVALECPLLSIRQSDVLQQLDVPKSASSSSSSGMPFYDADREQLMMYVKPRYGVHLWTLPTLTLSMQYVLQHWVSGIDASNISSRPTATSSSTSSSAMPVGYRTEDLETRWFSRCLLFGQITLPIPVPQLQRAMLADAHCIQQAKPHPKLLPLLSRLVQHRVCNRLQLMRQLRAQPHFLAKEIEGLLKADQQRGFRVQWNRLAKYLETTESNPPPPPAR